MNTPVDAEFLCSLPVRSLAALLACGDVSAVVVLAAFRDRARLAHAKLNIVTEWLDAAADARAAELDAELAATGTPRGPLHGVPFTLKDHFHLAGARMTMGEKLQSRKAQAQQELQAKAKELQAKAQAARSSGR